jgi:hypothetical protein
MHNGVKGWQPELLTNQPASKSTLGKMRVNKADFSISHDSAQFRNTSNEIKHISSREPDSDIMLGKGYVMYFNLWMKVFPECPRLTRHNRDT